MIATVNYLDDDLALLFPATNGDVPFLHTVHAMFDSVRNHLVKHKGKDDNRSRRNNNWTGFHMKGNMRFRWPEIGISDTDYFACDVINTRFADIFVRKQVVCCRQTLYAVDALSQGMAYFRRFCTTPLQGEQPGNGGKVVFHTVMQFPQ